MAEHPFAESPQMVSLFHATVKCQECSISSAPAGAGAVAFADGLGYFCRSCWQSIRQRGRSTTDRPTRWASMSPVATAPDRPGRFPALPDGTADPMPDGRTRSLRSFDAPPRWRGSRLTPPGYTRSPRRPLASSRSLLRARLVLSALTISNSSSLPRRPNVKPSPNMTRLSGSWSTPAAPTPLARLPQQHDHGGPGSCPRGSPALPGFHGTALQTGHAGSAGSAWRSPQPSGLPTASFLARWRLQSRRTSRDVVLMRSGETDDPAASSDQQWASRPVGRQNPGRGQATRS